MPSSPPEPELPLTIRTEPSCPECKSRDLNPLGRQHSLHLLKHPATWIFLFPAMLFLLLQYPMLMKCESCETSFIYRSLASRIYRLLLILAILGYAWLVIEVAKETIR